jgi:hypothetical protein
LHPKVSAWLSKSKISILAGSRTLLRIYHQADARPLFIALYIAVLQKKYMYGHVFAAFIGPHCPAL